LDGGLELTGAAASASEAEGELLGYLTTPKLKSGRPVRKEDTTNKESEQAETGLEGIRERLLASDSESEDEGASDSDSDTEPSGNTQEAQAPPGPFSWSQLAEDGAGEAALGPAPSRQLQRASGGRAVQAPKTRFTDRDRLPGEGPKPGLGRRKPLGVRMKNRLDAGLVTATTPKKIKRFYEDVTVHQSGDFWHVLLDGKVVKTPRGTVLELPGKGVAKQVAMEWTAQETHLQPLEMPFTTIGCTALDITREDPAACVERLLPFLEMDTVCFQGDGELLAERQQQEWGPLREWFQTQYGVRLSLASGLAPPPPPGALPGGGGGGGGRSLCVWHTALLLLGWIFRL
ncbi:unnamed protein product, partial [Effrenium voratum]